MNANGPSSELEYNADNFNLESDDLFEWNDNTEQADASDNNANQSPHLDREDPMLPLRRNNPPRAPDDTASMVEFDPMQSSPPLEPVANDALLANSANWEPASTRDISAGIPEVDLVRRAINDQFNVKAKPWQVSVVVDITKRNQDVFAVAGTNAGKSLVYQSILVITSGSVLVISPTITLMEDQICHDNPYHYVGGRR